MHVDNKNNLLCLCCVLHYFSLYLHSIRHNVVIILLHPLCTGVCAIESSKLSPLYTHMHVIIYYILCSFIQYHSTSLERGHKHDLLTEVDLGVPIDLILPETYSRTEAASKFSICSCTMAVLQPCTNFKLLRYNVTLQKITYIYIIKC